MMRGAVASPAMPATRVQSVASGGEPLGKELLARGRANSGVDQRVLRTNGMQHGAVLVRAMVRSRALAPSVKAGARPRRRGDRRTRSAHAAWRKRLDCHSRTDPVMFLGYWRDDESTRLKFRNGFLR